MNDRELRAKQKAEELGKIIGMFLVLIFCIVIFTWLSMLVLGLLFNQIGVGAAVPFFSPIPWAFGGITGFLFWRFTQ